MRDPERLLDHGATDGELALLTAARSEEPPSDGPARLRVALGLTAGVLTVAAASTVTASATSASASSVAPMAAAVVPKLGAAKLLAWLVVAGGALGVGTAVLVTAPAHVAPHARPVATKLAPTTPAPTTLAPPVEAPAPVAAPGLAHAPEGALRQPPREQAAPRALRSIGAETATLDRARAALQRGDGQTTLAVLERYQRAHPRGVLRQEAEVLRIEALLGTGEPRAARRRAARFLRNNPHSPHAERLRLLLSNHGP